MNGWTIAFCLNRQCLYFILYVQFNQFQISKLKGNDYIDHIVYIENAVSLLTWMDCSLYDNDVPKCRANGAILNPVHMSVSCKHIGGYIWIELCARQGFDGVLQYISLALYFLQIVRSPTYFNNVTTLFTIETEGDRMFCVWLYFFLLRKWG